MKKLTYKKPGKNEEFVILRANSLFVRVLLNAGVSFNFVNKCAMKSERIKYENFCINYIVFY